MSSAIRRLFLGRAVTCAICGEHRYCQHQDDELRGDVCSKCVVPLGNAEHMLREEGWKHCTEWDEETS